MVLRGALPLLPIAGIGAALTWLNRGPWWAWLVLAALLAAVGWAAVRLRIGRRPASRAVVRIRGAAAWLVAAALVAGVAVIAHPAPQQRAAGGRDGAPTAPVRTSEGLVTGITDRDGAVEVFAGIPYAAPPVGPRRWRAPEPPVLRSTPLAADRFSAVPVQPTSTFASRALSQVLEVPLEQTLLNPYPVSEDSLTLNIWRRAPQRSSAAPLRPVLVYIPGGGFASGSGALPLYDGGALAARGDIVTVTINYRLGVFGFLSHPELAAESAHGASGNYGILDQVAALTWLRDNIAAFGGDPRRITVAGESAGGDSVCILGATRLAEGLVDGMIGSSGACMGTTGDTERGDQADARAAAERAGRRLSARLDGASIAELRAMPAERIREAAGPLDRHWRPSIDGHVLDRSPAEIYASGDQLDVPLLTGSTADESSLALASPPDTAPDVYRAEVRRVHGGDADRLLRLYPGRTPAEVLDSRLRADTDRVMTRAHRRWALLHARTSGASTFAYHFTRTPPDPRLERFGAFHGADVAYAYDNLDADSAADLRPVDLRLRDEMSGAWIAFVRRGDPNGGTLPEWPTVQHDPDLVMEFGDRGSVVAPRPRSGAVDFWLAYEGPVR